MKQTREPIDAAFDFDREVKKAYEDHPSLKRDTYFISIDKDRVVIPEAAQNKLDRSGRAHLALHIRDVRRNKYPRYVPRLNRALPFNAVILYTKSDRYRGFHPRGYTEGQKARALFDHELGHALTLHFKGVWNASWRSQCFAEAIAEDFSLLRQFQRYGDHPGIQVEKLIAHRRDDVLSRRESSIYYVMPALENLMSLKQRFNFSALTPRQTVMLAHNAAVETTPDVRTVRKIIALAKHRIC